MTDAIKLAIEALEAGLDCAQEVAHRTHEELKGYKPHRHAAVDADVSKIEAALAALRARPAGWIAVSERLPEPWDAVMVHPRPNDYVNEAYLNHKGVWMYTEYVTDFGDRAYPCVVTHWMPLPPPPGQERAQPDHSYEFPSAPKHHDLIAELRKPMHYLSMAKRNRAADALEGKL